MALILGVAILAAEGYLVYEFYSTPAPTSATALAAPVEAGGPLEETASPSTEAATGLPQTPELKTMVEDCSDKRDQCVRELVETIAPEATYAGGRIDTDTEDPGQSRNVLFFEDPDLGYCEYKQLEYQTNKMETYYMVIIAGEGSYNEEDGAGCVPQA